ncbi:lasso peptide biosynthesis B2 protein [Streptomyces sp. P1-3]|uniref:lasso peptide biosynthesis B2 protein n=1 Tax=Streptomyces sp. P1-3 TaxID=3421658 RepID=UPI003D36C997
MNSANTVSVTTANAEVTIDYRTGSTQLRPLTPGSAPAGAGSVVRHDGPAISWGTFEVSAVLPTPDPVPLRWRIGAVPAVALTAAVMLIGPQRGRFARMVRLACAGRALPAANDQQAVYAVRAMRRAAAVIPASWACLEQSTAAAVLLALAGRRAEWRHGVATDPVRLHAWIADSAGHPVEEPADTALYTPTYTPDGPSPANQQGPEGTTT